MPGTTNQIEVTSELIQDLRISLATGMPRRAHREADSGPTGPPFGMVYFGSFSPFAGGKAHYGMVRTMGGVAKCRGGRRYGPSVPFAPITSKPQRSSPVRALPPGTLPSKRGPRGESLAVRSYVLLFWRILVRSGRMHSLEPVRKLEDAFCEQAMRLLKGAR